MQLCIRRLACLALLVGVLAMATTAFEMKMVECCTRVSTMNITVPILSYRVQWKKHPCVHAVVFKTTKGEFCSHHKQAWVLDKIREFRAARRAKNTTAVPATKTFNP